MHKGTPHPGEHAPIIDRATWDKVHAILAENTVARANGTRAQTPALLRGLIFAPGGHATTPSHTRKNGKLYRYYVATDAIRKGYAECPVRSVPAAEVVAQVRHLLRTPEIIARTWAAANREDDEPIPERDVVKTITDLAPLWNELFPAEQARIVRLLVERIDLAPDGMQVQLHCRGAADVGRGRQIFRKRFSTGGSQRVCSWRSWRGACQAAGKSKRSWYISASVLGCLARRADLLVDQLAGASFVLWGQSNYYLDLGGTLLAPKAMQLEELTGAIPSEWEKQRRALLSGAA